MGGMNGVTVPIYNTSFSLAHVFEPELAAGSVNVMALLGAEGDAHPEAVELVAKPFAALVLRPMDPRFGDLVEGDEVYLGVGATGQRRQRRGFLRVVVY